MKLHDRLTLAVCESIDEKPCSETCSTCRRLASANLIRGVMPEVE